MTTKLTKSRGIRLTEEEWAAAHEAGDGNESQGIRLLLEERNLLKEQNGKLSARWLAISNELQKLEVDRDQWKATAEKQADISKDLDERFCAALAELRQAKGDIDSQLGEYTHLADEVGSGNRWLGFARLLEERKFALDKARQFVGQKEQLRQERDEARQRYQPVLWIGYGALACAILYSAALWMLSLFY